MAEIVATIGMFDGVHRGHQFVLQQVVLEARKRGLQSMVITFDRLPRREQVLLPLKEKLKILSEQGLDKATTTALATTARRASTTMCATVRN